MNINSSAVTIHSCYARFMQFKRLLTDCQSFSSRPIAKPAHERLSNGHVNRFRRIRDVMRALHNLSTVEHPASWLWTSSLIEVEYRKKLHAHLLPEALSAYELSVPVMLFNIAYKHVSYDLDIFNRGVGYSHFQLFEFPPHSALSYRFVEMLLLDVCVLNPFFAWNRHAFYVSHEITKVGKIRGIPVVALLQNKVGHRLI